MKTFSIVTPIYAYTQQKADELLRCIASIRDQKYPKKYIQHIIVNDGSPITLRLPNHPWLKVINQPNMQRITAYNEGLKQTKNEVIWILDADDELVPNALDTINNCFRGFPQYKMFNFGCTYVHKDGGVTKRDAFKPKALKVGHEIFGGGNIVNGTFVFDRSIYEDLGAFPENEIKQVDCTDINYPAGGSMVRDLTMSSPYDWSAYAQLEFPEIRKYFMVNVESEPDKIIKELGNPWGQDFYLAYKYTRKYHSKSLDNTYLEVVHLR